MKTLNLVAIGVSVLVVASLLPAEDAASKAAADGDSYKRHAYSFQVDVPDAAISTATDGATQIKLPGFRIQETRIGAPDLPARSYRVAIPPAVTPRLVVRVLEESLLTGTRPRPVPEVRFDVTGDPGGDTLQALGPPNVERHERFQEDSAIYAADAPWPATIARLGEVGIFRDQRYVSVVVSPARYDPKAGGVRVARKIEIQVHFDGDSGERSAPMSDPQLESIYREMFVNYAEGKTFRMGKVDLAARPAAPKAMFEGPNYAGPVYKIKTRVNKTVRLDSTFLAATGLLAHPLSSWKLTSRGVEVPLSINDVNSNDMLDAPDWVQFWGQALDDEPKTTLNTDIPGTNVDIFQAADFSDENVYFLSIDAGIRLRMTMRDAAPTFSRPVQTTFAGIARAEIDNAFRPLAEKDPWYWGPALKSTGGNTRTDIVALPGLASTTSPIRVVVPIRGLSENANLSPDHHTQVTLLNQSLQTLADDDKTFDGRMIYTHDFTWPGTGSFIASNPVQIKVDAEAIAAGFHEVMLDRIEIHYTRTFQSFGDTLEFPWADGDGEFIVTGLTSPAVEAWELTWKYNGIVTPVRATAISVTGPGACPTPPGGSNCYTARLRIDNDPDINDGALRQFVVFGTGAIATPVGADFAVDTESDLWDPDNQADIIVITHRDIHLGTCETKLDELLEWRDENQGLSAKIVYVDDIYDEFNDGQSGPGAIRKFLEFVMSANPGDGWLLPKPKFVLLLGDGSNDYKLGPAAGNFIPTQVMFKDDPVFGYFFSDSFLTAVVTNDAMPDIPVGRIPVRSETECFAALNKILNYQDSPPTGNWRRHGVVISDHGKNFNVNESLEFEETNDLALAWMKRPPHTSRRMRFWTDPDYCGGNVLNCDFECAPSNKMRDDITAAFNGTDGFSDGVGIMQFVGHGNFDVWSDDSFFDNGAFPNRTSCRPYPSGERDTDFLVNGGKLPILFVHNCLSTGLISTSRTLGRDIFKKADGGSVAVFSPSGLTNGYFGQEASDVVWGSFFGRDKDRLLATVTMKVYADFCGGNSIEACENYLLFGDPATIAAFPTVAPPTQIVATPSNARVDLSWTASATPGARYDVYRAVDNPAGTYTRLNGNTPVNATVYADTAVTNARTYYYYLIAVDNELFESRQSHFNSDCPVNGSDCLKAKPLNPNAPAAPAGVVVVDAEVGGKLIVSWTINPESDIKLYQVKYGTNQGSHPNVANAGTATSIALTGLQNTQPYWIVVTATNTSDLTSIDSAEVSGTPTFVRGLRAPQFISALHVDKSGDDALLSWPAVTSNIYNKPTTIARYEIYRGTTPTFVPTPGNKIGETTPPSTSFTDPLALLAGPGYHYLVQAVDTQGSEGGLGNQLPNGIGALTVDKSTGTPGNIVLSWAAVTNDFDLRPLAIDHYEIYARSTPFTMANVRDGVIPMILSTASVSVDLTPPPGNAHYSVIAVDVKGNKSPF